MPGRLDDRDCVFCEMEKSTPRGEHVLPQWLLRALWTQEAGPYTTYRNDELVQTRDGHPRRQSSAARFQLPVGPECNGILDRRFEKPAKDLIRAMLLEEASLSGDQLVTIGLWFVKTWILLAHPALVVSDPGFTMTHWEPWDPRWEDWMMSGLEPPDGLSAWLTKVDHNETAESPRYIDLPLGSVNRDGAAAFLIDFGIGEMTVSVLYHPDWKIKHPLEDDGHAIRLWPEVTAESFNYSALRLVRRREVVWRESAWPNTR